jgi:hypothetical protein
LYFGIGPGRAGLGDETAGTGCTITLEISLAVIGCFTQRREEKKDIRRKGEALISAVELAVREVVQNLKEENVAKLNWSRILIGALVAAVICFLSDGFLHEKILGTDWKALYDHLGIADPPHHPSALAYFGLFDLGRGLIAILIYALMRPHYGPGPKTAALAGVVAWIAMSVTTPAQFVPLGFFSNALWLKAAGFQLVTSIVATIAGAALYKDALEPAVSHSH